MNSLTESNHMLQTGIWDKPQIISFDSLFTTYSVENTFEQMETEKMTPPGPHGISHSNDDFQRSLRPNGCS